ncbi:MAG: hypothetical protein GEU26_13915 [Nitrososphaeraceae archaeon]|nr:hypothetical protein [Nitrososphaeraceae archaeon]
MASSQEDYPEATNVIYDTDEIIRRAFETFYSLKLGCDVCADAEGPSMFVMPGHPVTKGFLDMKRRGIRLRFITEITKENISFCKELMKVVELKHLNEVKGNFGVGDTRINQASARNAGGSSPPPLLIESTVKAFVEQQQYFFEMLWKKAIPAKQRIKEIEEGIKREFIETIQDPSDTLNLIRKSISSATEEIMIMFPTVKSFQSYKKEGLLNLLKRQVENKIPIRILLSEKDRLPHETWQEISAFPNLQIQYTDQLPSSKLTMIIVDNESSLVRREEI